MRHLILLAVLWSGSAAAEVVHLLSYHNHPPFVTAPGVGETYQLAAKLNAAAPTGWHFEVELLPRMRLNQRLQSWIGGDCPAPSCADNWIVPWVNPQWGFRPKGGDPYAWQAQMDDANVIVSRQAAPIDYQTPSSLDGKILAGIRGHHYVGIDERVASGQIKRIDSNVERDNLLMLLYGRVDAVLLPSSTVRYLLQRDPLLRDRATEFYLAPIAHQRYTRSIMLPAGRTDLQQMVRAALAHQ